MAEFEEKLVVAFDGKRLRRWFRLARRLIRAYVRLYRCRPAAEAQHRRRFVRLLERFEAFKEGFQAEVKTKGNVVLATFPILKRFDLDFQSRLSAALFEGAPGVEIVLDLAADPLAAAEGLVRAVNDPSVGPSVYAKAGR